MLQLNKHNIANSIKKLIEPILGYGLIILFVLIILSIIAIFGGAVMQLFGFEYKSIGSIIIFFVISTILSLPISILAKAFPKALLELNRLNLLSARVLYVILDTIATAIGMLIVDYFMKGVSASQESIFVIALLLAILSAKDDIEKD